MSKQTTHKNPRREVLARLKEIKNSVLWLVNGFTVTSTVYEEYLQADGRRNAHQVPRPYDRYPENQPSSWGTLYAEADRLVALASALREFAAEQHHAAVARNAAR